MLKKYGYHDLDGGRGVGWGVSSPLSGDDYTTCYESYYLLRVIPSITVLKHSTMLKKYGYHDLDGGWGGFPHHCQVGGGFLTTARGTVR